MQKQPENSGGSGEVVHETGSISFRDGPITPYEPEAVKLEGKPWDGETDIAFGHPSEPPTPRERFHRIIGHPVSAEQWQLIKEFVRDNPVT